MMLLIGTHLPYKPAWEFDEGWVRKDKRPRYHFHSSEALNLLAEWTGLEPATPGVTGRYSNQLNYHSAWLQHGTLASLALQNLATLRGFEPRYLP